MSNNILLSEDTIKQHVKRIGKEISETYSESKEPIIIIGLLKGCFVFMADLVREISVPLQVEFMTVSSYENNSKQKELKVVMDINCSIYNRDVILVDEIIDTGRTFSKIIELIQSKSPKSLKTCTLLNKECAREVEVPIDFVGEVVPDKYLIGYGLDDNGLSRNLPYVGFI